MGILDLSNGEHEDCVILAGFVPLQAGFITVSGFLHGYCILQPTKILLKYPHPIRLLARPLGHLLITLGTEGYNFQILL